MRVTQYRVVPDAGRAAGRDRPVTGSLVVTIEGTPNRGMEATGATLDFVPDGTELPAPGYDRGRREIAISFHRSQYGAVMDVLRGSGRAYVQVREDRGGSLHADVHGDVQSLPG